MRGKVTIKRVGGYDPEAPATDHDSAPEREPVLLDAEVTTREELARWLDAVGERIAIFHETADVPDDLASDFDDAADACSTLAHMMFAELCLVPSCAGDHETDDE